MRAMEISSSQLLAQRLHLGDSINRPPRPDRGGISENEILKRLHESRDTMELLI